MVSQEAVAGRKSKGASLYYGFYRKGKPEQDAGLDQLLGIISETLRYRQSLIDIWPYGVLKGQIELVVSNTGSEFSGLHIKGTYKGQ